MNKIKTFPDTHLCDGENMKDKKVGYVYGYLLAISFLSTGMSALITFPRSIRLVDVGISVAFYGFLLSLSNGLTGCLNVLFGRLIDKHACLEQILKSMLVLSLLGHGVFACTKNSGILAIMFVVEVAAYKIFSTFMYRLIERISGSRYGESLGMYKMAGSIAWIIFAAASGFIVQQFNFRCLALLVVLMGCMKLVLFVKLFEFYKRHSPEGHKARSKTKLNITVGMINLFFLYMLMQLQSNGGFSYLQIYLSRELGLDEIISGIIVSSSGFFEIFISAWIGKLCDFSKRMTHQVLVVGCILSAIRWLLLATAGSVPTLIFTQFLHGIMICTINITFMSYLRQIVRTEELGTMLGFMGAISSLGTIVGAGAFGYFSELYSLKIAYFGLGFFSLIGVGIYLLEDKLFPAIKK